eukprot:gene5607-6297_t
MGIFNHKWTEEHVEEYVQKYMEDYDDETVTEYSESSEDDFNARNNTDLQAFLDTEAAKERRVRQKKADKYFKSMVRHSTFHGLQFCFKKEHPLRRLFWIVLLLLCNGLLLQKMFESTRHYLSFPFSTTKTVVFEKALEFPAVSLCNLNDMRHSQMIGTKLHEMIKRRDYNFSGQLSGDEYQRTIRTANHKLENMLYDCRMDGRKCTSKDFTLFYHKQGDKCYTFNSGQSGYKVIKVNKLGLQHALELTINIEFWDYYDDAVQSGVHLILHGQEETPVQMQGIVASPGFITYVELKKQKIKSLPAPYKTHCGSLKLNYFKGYSMHLCWLEKLTDYVVGHCGCKDWFMPGNYDVCSLKKLETCLWAKWVEFDKFKLYSCPLPCVVDSYIAKTSFSRFPVHQKSDEIAKHFKRNGTLAENHHFTRENFLRLIIYYGDLSYEYLEQKPTYDLLVFLGDIGGQIGLFVGASVLTFFEFVDCFVMCIYSRFFQVDEYLAK